MKLKYLLIFISLLSCAFTNAQSYTDINYFKGSILDHSPAISPLITGKPEGFVASWSKKTFGTKAWHEVYNYPDFGISVSYQDLKNPILGENFGVYGHYSFYFLKRMLMLRIAQGIAYTTNPYAKNQLNNAFGTALLSSEYFMLQFKKERLLGNFGLQAGAMLLHYSNGNAKPPNKGLNTTAFTFGINYNFSATEPEFIANTSPFKYNKTWQYHAVFRTGVSSLDILDVGTYSFYNPSFYAGKHIGPRNSLHGGVEVFFSNYLKKYVELVHPLKEGVEPDSDYKQVGVFAGHELYVGNLSLLTQFGYYAYYPFPFVERIYLRVGLQYYINNMFTGITLKSHGAKAERIEFILGYRF